MSRVWDNSWTSRALDVHGYLNPYPKHVTFSIKIPGK